MINYNLENELELLNTYRDILAMNLDSEDRKSFEYKKKEVEKNILKILKEANNE